MAMLDHKFSEKATGGLEDALKDVAKSLGVRLDKDKYEFLSNIAKTRYSGLNVTALIASFKILENKDESWFQELIDDGLAETYTFQGTSASKNKWDGWFITARGRQVIREAIKRM